MSEKLKEVPNLPQMQMDIFILDEQNIEVGEEIINFKGIAGGFGDKLSKSMLVKDIAEIHDKPIKEVNRIINNNLRWFIDGVDIVDIKQVLQKHLNLQKQLGFTKAQIGNASNVYLLSERGYATLIKFFEDDLAMNIYKKLLSDYFEMKIKITEDLERQIGRKLGMIDRRNLTDSIKATNPPNSYIYANSTNAIYKGIFGKTASQIRKTLGLPKSKSIRDHLSTEELQILSKAENDVATLVDYGLPIDKAIRRVINKLAKDKLLLRSE